MAFNTENISRKILEILGNREKCFEYGLGQSNYRDHYIYQVLHNSNSIIGIEIASTIRAWLPVYRGKKIFCHDVINPFQITKFISCNRSIDTGKSSWEFTNKEIAEKFVLIQDEEFLVMLENRKKVIHIYMYRK